MIPGWALELVDIPFFDQGRSARGADCWGIVYLALAKLGHDVPTYADDYASAKEREVVAALIEGERSVWEEVDPGAIATGDVLLLARGTWELASHVGIVVCRGLMLHMRGQRRSAIETYSSRRIAGVYRWDDG